VSSLFKLYFLCFEPLIHYLIVIFPSFQAFLCLVFRSVVVKGSWGLYCKCVTVCGLRKKTYLHVIELKRFLFNGFRGKSTALVFCVLMQHYTNQKAFKWEWKCMEFAFFINLCYKFVFVSGVHVHSHRNWISHVYRSWYFINLKCLLPIYFHHFILIIHIDLWYKNYCWLMGRQLLV